MLRRLLTPRWLLALLVSLAAAAAMVRLGMWQLGRGEARHSLQSYSYAVEWVLFAAFTLFCFGKLLLDSGNDGGREVAVQDPPASVVLPPPAPVGGPVDDELAAYNAYLARLNATSL